MGLFDRFKKAPAKPEAVAAQGAPDRVCSPVDGRVERMTDAPDPVFSSEALGKGCIVWPTGDVVYAPVSGAVSVCMGHAVGLAGDDGVEVLVHVGVDTVEMGGKGFTAHVAQGDHVDVGQPLLSIDRKAIAAAGHPDCVVVAVSNSGDLADVSLIAEAGLTVRAGEAVLGVTR